MYIRPTIIQILEILDENNKLLSYTHHPLAHKEIPQNYNNTWRKRNEPFLKNLDLFFISPIIPKYDVKKLDKFQDQVYEMFNNLTLINNYSRIENSHLECGRIIHNEKNSANIIKRAKLLIYPSFTLAEQKYLKHINPIIPLSIIEQEKKERLEAKVIELFPQVRRKRRISVGF